MFCMTSGLLHNIIFTHNTWKQAAHPVCMYLPCYHVIREELTMCVSSTRAIFTTSFLLSTGPPWRPFSRMWNDDEGTAEANEHRD